MNKYVFIGLLLFSCNIYAYRLIWEDSTHTHHSAGNANNFCQHKYGGKLATIRSEDEWNLIKQRGYKKTWIGLNKHAIRQTWQFNEASDIGIDGIILDDMDFWSSPPGNKEYCALVDGTHLVSAHCSEAYTAKGFLCDAPLPFIREEGNTASNPQKNWVTANEDCKIQYDTALATIHIEQELNLILQYSTIYPTVWDYNWIGLRSLANNEWVWNNQDGSSGYDIETDGRIERTHEGEQWALTGKTKLFGYPGKQVDNTKGYICDMPAFSVEITSCANWNHGSASNLLQIQLKGSEGSTTWAYVNKYKGLPTHGATDSYYISNYQFGDTDIGNLLSVVLRVDDPDGYCITDLTIQTYAISTAANGGLYLFSSQDYWGDGIVLSNQCAYSYQFLSNDMPLISCHENNFELKTDSQRGIYTVDIHTCQGKMGSDISAQNMKNNVYLTIMGNNEKTKDYVQTEVTFLDHYVVNYGNIDLSMVGHLMASNVQIADNYENAPTWYYSAHNDDIVKQPHPQGKPDKPLTIMGLQIESVDWESYPISTDMGHTVPIEVRLDGEILTTLTKGNNKRFYTHYFNEFPNPELSLNTRVEIIRKTNEFSSGLYNVYFILMDYYANGYHKDYKLPFEFRRAERIKMNWFEANQYCKETFGTSLASIHSQKELAFIDVSSPGQKQWIGLFNKRNNKNDQNWIWSDKSYFDSSKTYWKNPSVTDEDVAKDCAVINYGKWEPEICTNNDTVNYFVCASPNWLSNTHRTFQVNSAQKIDDITLVTVGNNNNVDDICIDSIRIDDTESRYLSSNWISKGEALHAIHKHPVCGLEITKIDILYEGALSGSVKIPQDSKKVGYKCENENGIIDTVCSVSETVEFEKTTEFSLEKEWSHSSEFSFGNEETNSRDVKFGTEIETSVGGGVSGEGLFAGSSVAMSVGSGVSWGDGDGSSNTASRQWRNSKGVTDTTHRTWTTSDTTSVECSAEIEVPPGFSVEYELLFDAVDATLETQTDIKLTLCSAYLGDKDDTEKYVYINDIKGIIHTKETQTCFVNFNVAQCMPAEMTCNELQQLAIAEKSTWSPICKKDNPDKYNGCQCDIGDSRSLATCWCVNEDGNAIAGQYFEIVDESESWKDVCKTTLACANSDIE